MEPATTIIKKCGGIAETARLALCNTNWVYRWNIEVSKGGTGGRVPRKAQDNLLAASERKEANISVTDFYPGAQ